MRPMPSAVHTQTKTAAAEKPESFSQADIDALKQAGPMISLLERYAKPRGAVNGQPRFTCPFHEHKHPNKPHLRVEERGGRARAICDTYGVVGDVFALLEQLEGIHSFPEQVRMVAELTGYHLRGSSPRAPRAPRRGRLKPPAPAAPQQQQEEPQGHVFTEEEDIAICMSTDDAMEQPGFLRNLSEELGITASTLEFYLQPRPPHCFRRKLRSCDTLLGVSDKGRLLYLYYEPGPDGDARLVMVKERNQPGRTPRFICRGRKRCLWGMGAARDAQEVFITEGESDALALADSLNEARYQLAFPAMEYEPGSVNDTFDRIAVVAKPDAGTFREEWAAAMRGKRVILVRDNDEAGLRGAQDTARKLHEAGVEEVYCWAPPEGYKDARAFHQEHVRQRPIAVEELFYHIINNMSAI